MSRLTFASVDKVRVTLTDHGIFETTVAEVEKADKKSKAELASRIADCYSDSRQYHKTYWGLYPKAVLAVVYGGLVAPTL